MISEQNLPKIHKYRFCIIIRMIASILIVTFLAQDIVWAQPDIITDRNSENNKLAPKSLFKHASDDRYAAYLCETIKKEGEKIGCALNELTFEAAKNIIKLSHNENWRIYEPTKNELLVTFAGGNMLRFYDLHAPEESDYSNKVIEELRMPGGSQFKIQYMRIDRLQNKSSDFVEKKIQDNIFAEEQRLNDHFTVNSVVRSSAKAYLSKPAESIYVKRADEIEPETLSPDDIRAKKIRGAINYLEKQGGRFARRAAMLKSTVTVIGLTDMRTNFIVSDIKRNVFSAIHAGRRRNVLYLSTHIVDKLDVKWLALLLNAGVRFIEAYNEFAAAFKMEKLSDGQSLSSPKLELIHKKLEDARPLTIVKAEKNLWRAADIQKLFTKLAGEDSEFKSKELMQVVNDLEIKARWFKSSLEEKYGKTEEDVNSRRFNPDDLRNDYVNLANMHGLIAANYLNLGKRVEAVVHYRKKNKIIKYIQRVDAAVWPVQVQESLVKACLRAGMYEEFLDELKILLTGDGWPEPILQNVVDVKQAQQDERRWLVERGLYDLRNEIAYLLYSHESMASRRIRRDVRLNFSKAMRLFDSFEAEMKENKKADIGGREKNKSSKEKRSFWTSLGAAITEIYKSFRGLYRYRRGMVVVPFIGEDKDAAATMKRTSTSVAIQAERDETIYEINVRALGKRFSEISDEDISKFRDDSGATVLWMMGAWQLSPCSKAVNYYWCKKNNEALERTASAFSITEYKISDDLGGEAEFREFVNRANKLGVKVMLDVVPNHMAADTPLLMEHPEYFMSLSANLSEEEAAKWIRQNKGQLKLMPENNPCPIFQAGTHGADTSTIPDPTSKNVFYFGRDASFLNPNAIPWVDTVQFNYANAAMRQYMGSVLFKAAELTNGGGIRLDMVFLATKDHVYGNWFSHLSRDEFEKLYASEEFWKEVVVELKEKYPGIVILSEMYGSHGHSDFATNLGFDYYYEDYFFKCLTCRDINGLKNFLKGYVQGLGRKNFVKYMENHDSADRIINVLRRNMGDRDAVPASLAAATLLYTLPGGALLYRGQEKGHSQWISNASLIRGPPEQEDEKVSAHYREISGIIRDKEYRDIFRKGSLRLLDTSYPSDIVAFEREYNGKKAVIVVNYCNSELGNIKLNIDGREEVLSMPAWSSRIYLPPSAQVKDLNSDRLLVSHAAAGGPALGGLGLSGVYPQIGSNPAARFLRVIFRFLMPGAMPLSFADESAGASRAASRDAVVDVSPIEHDFVSPVKAGINTDGTFLPHIQGRSEKDWGVLDFGSYKTFVKATKLMGQHIIQWLPMMMSSAGNSPYSVASRKIIDPKYIDIEGILELIPSSEAKQFVEDNRGRINRLHDSDEVQHDEIMELKLAVLRKMWLKFNESKDSPLFKEYQGFLEQNESELKYHILYLELKKKYLHENGASGWDWRTWNKYEQGLSDFGLDRFDESKHNTNPAIEKARAENKSEIDFQLFVQFVARRQMRELADYARMMGVEFAIDLPFAYDGADIWLNPKVFGLKKENNYKRLATQGVPPEESNPKEQHWQFYPYDWSSPEAIKFLDDTMTFYKNLGFVYNRKDHVLGYYRTYLLTQDVDNDMTLKSLGLWNEISNKIRNVCSDADKDRVTNEIRELIMNKLRLMKREGRHPGMPDDALDLLLDENGNLRPDNLIRIGREVPEDQHNLSLGRWDIRTREYIVEKQIYEGKPKWDFIRISPSSQTRDNGFLKQYLFPGNGALPPQESDNVLLGYFKLAKGESTLSQFLKFAQENGLVEAWEVLGTVIPDIDESTKRLGGYSLAPVIWGLGQNDTYFPYRHPVNTFTTGSVADSTTLKGQWEVELDTYEGRNRKRQMLWEWFNTEPDEWEINHFTARVQCKILENIYASKARMVVLGWVDILGLGGEYRLNTPGAQTQQWIKRLPKDVTVEAILAAAEGGVVEGRVAEAVKLLKELGAARKQNYDDGIPKILSVDPGVDSAMEEIREEGEPFLVDAYIYGDIDQVSMIVGINGKKVKVPMQHCNVKSGLGNIQKWTTNNWAPKKPGRYSFYIEAVTSKGGKINSKSGKLFLAPKQSEHNTLSPVYTGRTFAPASVVAADIVAASGLPWRAIGIVGILLTSVVLYVWTGDAMYLGVGMVGMVAGFGDYGKEPKPLANGKNTGVRSVAEERMRYVIDLANDRPWFMPPVVRVAGVIYGEDGRIIGSGTNKGGRWHGERAAIINAFENVWSAKVAQDGLTEDMQNARTLLDYTTLRFKTSREFPEETVSYCEEIARLLGEPLKNTILYANMETCEDCAKIVYAAGIRDVIFGMKNVNFRKADDGQKAMEQLGMKVISGVLESEAKQQNKRFIHYRETDSLLFRLGHKLYVNLYCAFADIYYARKLRELRKKAEQIITKEKAGSGNSIVIKSHQNKLQEALTKSYRAVVFDCDGTITERGVHEVPDEVINRMVNFLERGVYVVLSTGRVGHADPEQRAAGYDDIEEIFVRIRAKLKDKSDLKYLLGFGQTGIEGFNGFENGDPRRKEFNANLEKLDRKTQGNIWEHINRLHPEEIDYPEYKSHAMALHIKWEYATREFMLSVLAETKDILGSKGSSFECLSADNTINITPIGAKKSNAIKVLVSEFGIPEEAIVSADDAGSPEGNGYPLTERLGGFCVGGYEAPESSVQISMPLALGLKNVKASIWLMDNLKFVGEKKSDAPAATERKGGLHFLRVAKGDELRIYKVSGAQDNPGSKRLFEILVESIGTDKITGKITEVCLAVIDETRPAPWPTTTYTLTPGGVTQIKLSDKPVINIQLAVEAKNRPRTAVLRFSNDFDPQEGRIETWLGRRDPYYKEGESGSRESVAGDASDNITVSNVTETLAAQDGSIPNTQLLGIAPARSGAKTGLVVDSQVARSTVMPVDHQLFQPVGKEPPNNAMRDIFGPWMRNASGRQDQSAEPTDLTPNIDDAIVGSAAPDETPRPVFAPGEEAKRTRLPKRTGKGNWDTLAKFRAELKGVPDSVVEKLRMNIGNIGELRRVLLESGLSLVREIDGKFLIQEIEVLLKDRTTAPAIRPVSNMLQQWYQGRQLVSFVGMDPAFKHIVKTYVSSDTKKVVRDKWLDDGNVTAAKRLNGLAVPTLVIDATQDDKKEFAFFVNGIGTKKTDIAIIQKRLKDLNELVKEHISFGQFEEAKNLIDQYKKIFIDIFRRGAIDVDYGNPLSNYGIDPDTGKLYIFDFGDLSSGVDAAYDFVDSLEHINEYIEHTLRVEIGDDIANYYKSNPFKESDFYSDKGRFLFGVDYDKDNPDSCRMQFPYSENQIRTMFSGVPLVPSVMGTEASEKVYNSMGGMLNVWDAILEILSDGPVLEKDLLRIFPSVKAETIRDTLTHLKEARLVADESGKIGLMPHNYIIMYLEKIKPPLSAVQKFWEATNGQVKEYVERLNALISSPEIDFEEWKKLKNDGNDMLDRFLKIGTGEQSDFKKGMRDAFYQTPIHWAISNLIKAKEKGKGEDVAETKERLRGYGLQWLANMGYLRHYGEGVATAGQGGAAEAVPPSDTSQNAPNRPTPEYKEATDQILRELPALVEDSKERFSKIVPLSSEDMPMEIELRRIYDPAGGRTGNDTFGILDLHSPDMAHDIKYLRHAITYYFEDTPKADFVTLMHKAERAYNKGLVSGDEYAKVKALLGNIKYKIYNLQTMRSLMCEVEETDDEELAKVVRAVLALRNEHLQAISDMRAQFPIKENNILKIIDSYYTRTKNFFDELALRAKHLGVAGVVLKVNADQIVVRVNKLVADIKNVDEVMAILPPIEKELLGKQSSFRYINHPINNAIIEVLSSRLRCVGDCRKDILVFVRILDEAIESLENGRGFNFDIAYSLDFKIDFYQGEMFNMVRKAFENNELSVKHVSGLRYVKKELQDIDELLSAIGDRIVIMDVLRPADEPALKAKELIREAKKEQSLSAQTRTSEPVPSSGNEDVSEHVMRGGTDGTTLATLSADNVVPARSGEVKVTDSCYSRLNADQKRSISRVNKHEDPVVSEILAAFLQGVSKADTISKLADHLLKTDPDQGEDYAAAHTAARRIVDWLTQPMAMAENVPGGEHEDSDSLKATHSPSEIAREVKALIDDKLRSSDTPRKIVVQVFFKAMINKFQYDASLFDEKLVFESPTAVTIEQIEEYLRQAVENKSIRSIDEHLVRVRDHNPNQYAFEVYLTIPLSEYHDTVSPRLLKERYVPCEAELASTVLPVVPIIQSKPEVAAPDTAQRSDAVSEPTTGSVGTEKLPQPPEVAVPAITGTGMPLIAETYTTPAATGVAKLPGNAVASVDGTNVTVDATDVMRDMIDKADVRLREALAANPLPDDAQILLSDELFDEVDKNNLDNVILKSNKVVKTASFDLIRDIATDEKLIKEISERKIGCVITRAEFARLCQLRGIKSEEDREKLKATILVIDDLKGANYLYLEGVLALVKSMMDKDPSRIRFNMDLLFENTIPDSALVDSLVLAMRVALKFKPIVEIDPDMLERYKAMMENLLMAV